MPIQPIDQKTQIASGQFLSLIFLVFGVLAVMGGTGLWYGDIPHFYDEGLSTANRILNQFTGVVLTSIALVTPLTSNLYSPKLVRLYLTHPIIISGLSLLLFGQGVLFSTLMLGTDHPNYMLGASVTVCVTYVAMAVLMPYLYFVSHFLRPSYFMPLLTKRAVGALTRILKRRKADSNDYDNFFETVDVIANIALTGMRRGDRRLILLCVHSLHRLLLECMTVFREQRADLEQVQPVFVAGLVREGQDYLRRQHIWPEAYILAHLLEIMEQTDRRQHQILAETAAKLVSSADLAVDQKRDDLIELHVLVFNALMRMTIEDKDVRKFQNLSYHYRLLMEHLAWAPQWLDEVVKHLLHYGRMAHRADMRGCMETVLYDLAELALSLSRIDPHLGTDFVESHAGPAWFESIGMHERLKRVAWRSMVRVYWESKVQDNRYLTELMQEQFLVDEDLHRAYIEKMLTNNRPLHWEFNDRLLRMAYLSPEAESKAWAFACERPQRLSSQEPSEGKPKA